MKLKPPVLPGHVGCTHPKACVARRCTNGCGELEHKKPAELVEGCLWHDLARGYVEGAWCGPGLIVQLRVALGRPSAARRGEGGTRNKPGSRPPGWNADASALLADIHARGRTGDEETLKDWRRQARTILGFSVPTIALPNAVCPACKSATLRVPIDLGGDVHCANYDCHDSDRYPWCVEDVNGYLFELGYGPRECRPTERSRAHGIHWDRRSMGFMVEQMESAKRESELADLMA